MSKFLSENKEKIIIYVILIIGFAVRLLGISAYPNALNVDEASSGYDAYSISEHGIDRNGNFLPVYLEAWGSGQSALYAYLTIPFIKIFGLNVFSIRIPMAIIGCISLLVFYKMLKRNTKKNITILGLIFFAIAPWHIMKSRWGMDCNIFPDFILYAIYFIIKYLQEKETKYIYIAAIITALSAYTYATSFLFLPIFVFALMIYMIIKKEMTIKQSIIFLSIVVLITFPMILYVIVNKFNLNTINLFITIPRLTENRFEEVSSIFGGDFFRKSIRNFGQAILILITQNDNLMWNALPVYGFTYIVSLPFMIIGIYKSFKEKKEINTIFNIWFIASVCLLFAVEPNINRINIIMIPIIYYTILGLTYTYERFGLGKMFLPIIYLSLFICFEISYYNEDYNNYFVFNNGIENVIKYVGKDENNKVYFEYAFKEPYIYVCFYNKIDCREYINTVKYKRNYGFDRVESFGKYYFYIPDKKEEDAVYVIKADNQNKYEFEDTKWEKKYIDKFVVIKSKN